MIEKLAIFTNCQVVVACSFWSDEVLRFGNKLVDPVYIIISAIEAVIRAEIQLVCNIINYYYVFLHNIHVRILYTQRHQ